jgi:hypothetical protein
VALDICELVMFPLIARLTVEPLFVVTAIVVVGVGEGEGDEVGLVIGVGVGLATKVAEIVVAPFRF